MGVRPRIQRCFLAWMEEARPRLAVPLRKLRRDDRVLVLAFEGLNPALNVVVSRDDIDVRVHWHGRDWDGVFSESVSTRRIAGGWTCEACPADLRKHWPSREALWREHLFESLLEWVNGSLVGVELIRFFGEGDRTTWVELVSAGQCGRAGVALMSVPLRGG